MNSKTYLKLLLVAGVLALVGGGAGTFASFNAETTNKDNTFATGSIQLENTQNGDTGNVCFSYAGTNNANGGCNAVVTAGSQAPGLNVYSGTVELKNTGSIDAKTFDLFAPSNCVDSVVPGLGVTNSTTGNPLCNAVVMYVEEVGQTSASSTTTTYTYCWYGYSSTTNTTCEKTKAALNLNATNTLAAFNATSGSHIQLSPLTASGTPDNTAGATKLASDATRTFEVGLYLPSATGNDYQALSSKFSLAWHIEP